ncbi:hypothetical protein BOW53_15795 [Solemya pervernicosa gill symbiont]|uniref:Serine protease n=2 Tax=Gammaproteobacteria incertae sedis TaxID=118884 RepID=A0A1T2KZX0_9GAMM|nr:serine protease [Candidatus Reidiella endopervernicosa]OOZ38371.1 hypothetical protein BOW53_15795 [Solemya pervernicosa gill symbiont]QKQ25905.1 trypsin-like peptidase domain-containing protein [Candidatus Reidiella endopervernicosa]
MVNRITLHSALLLALFACSSISHAADEARQLFSALKQQVYQVRVLDTYTSDQSSIGSGFLVTADGHIATNYHVVSSYVQKPENFRLEVKQHDDTHLQAKLVGFDIINDLAILQIEQRETAYFSISDGGPQQGERIYSIGNPHDLGMTIIEGNYNGLVETSRYDRLHFSGSLNPGMSGGPAVNQAGRVVGINVSKGGEHISFLVPAIKLRQLIDNLSDSTPSSEYQRQIGKALFSDQNQFYSSLFNAKTPLTPFGELLLPGQLKQSLKCWGHAEESPEIRYSSFHKHCKSQDNLYIDSDFRTGTFVYNYEWFDADRLNTAQFYNTLEKRFEHPRFGNTSDKERITEFACTTHFVTLADHSWKVSNCLRSYRDYAELYDASLLMVSVDEYEKAALITVGASGISKQNALSLFKLFMESMQWKS